MENSAQLNFILLGPPGCGKSTQAALFVDRFGLARVEMGSELRKIAEEDSAIGREVKEVISVRHELVRDDLVLQVLERAFSQVPKGQGIVLDGAPRCENQIEEVLQAFKDRHSEVKKVIFIDLPKEISVERISRRFSCTGCGAKYVIGSDVPNAESLCPVCGGKLMQREDDTTEGIERRWKIFHDETRPVLEYFAKNGKLLWVRGEQSAEDIFRTILEGIDV